MRVKVQTPVSSSLTSVKKRFDKELFLQLNPPFPPVKLLRFDGCRRGDRVILDLNFLLFRQEWESLITDDVDTADKFSFIDEGIRLPFFLKYWRHHHLVVHSGTGACIIDDIRYQTPNVLLDYLLWPLFWLQFICRKPIYRRIFNAPAPKRDNN